MVTVIAFIIAVLLGLVVMGFVFVPFSFPTFINPSVAPTNPVCTETNVECNADTDCAACVDGNVFDIKCEEMGNRKYCLPKKPDKPCNEALGGVWTWTGWASSNNKEWECLCTFPEIAGNRGCTRLNPNVCKGGTYNYNAKNNKKAPEPTDCECPKNSILMITEDKVPLCIPISSACPDKKMCESFYI